MFPETKKLYLEVEEHLQEVLKMAPKGKFTVEGERFKFLISAVYTALTNLRKMSDDEADQYYIIEKNPKHDCKEN